MNRRHNDYSPAKISTVFLFILLLLLGVHTHKANAEEAGPTTEEIKEFLNPNKDKILLIRGEDYDALITTYCVLVFNIDPTISTAECVVTMRASFWAQPVSSV